MSSFARSCHWWTLNGMAAKSHDTAFRFRRQPTSALEAFVRKRPKPFTDAAVRWFRRERPELARAAVPASRAADSQQPTFWRHLHQRQRMKIPRTTAMSLPSASPRLIESANSNSSASDRSAIDRVALTANQACAQHLFVRCGGPCAVGIWQREILGQSSRRLGELPRTNHRAG